jgi:hypothetical protein
LCYTQELDSPLMFLTLQDVTWTVRDSTPVRARFSGPIETGLEAQTVFCSMGTGSLSPGVKLPGRGVDHPPPSSPEVEYG